MPPELGALLRLKLKAAVDNVDEFAYVADIFFFWEFGQFGHLGSGVSVRWDEQGLETVRKMRRKEREGREKEVDASDNDTDKERAKERRGSKERRCSSEGRRCTALMDVFPSRRGNGSNVQEAAEGKGQRAQRFLYSILTIEEATVEAHRKPDDWDDVIAGYESGSVDVGSEAIAGGAVEEFGFKEKKVEVDAMLVKKVRILVILDATTNDLVMLINNLDLQATSCMLLHA
ncbi:hypothetical protein CVT25_004703 [Psilocybe cyanescens]|uniref:Uncharacterized protein n=1 Tax=Psilocybe cyanescens TaxID=93625 RepID=A0A409XIV3_PSICY|nr:hypothetical protein CVT25_004703 [Psilocybe cyanescens]